MSRSAVRLFLSLLLGCVPLLALTGQILNLSPQRRSFEPGAPQSLVQAGSVWQLGQKVKVVVDGFSISTDAKGKVVGSGGESRKDTQEVILYEVLIFVDEAGVRDALRLAGVSLDNPYFYREEQEVVRKGAFQKLIILRFPFSTPIGARAIRENLAGALAKYPGGSGSEAARFVSYLRGDFVKGDEVEIRLTPDGTVRTTVRGDAQQAIVSPELSDAFLSLWLMMDARSVRFLHSFVAAKSGS